MANNGTALATRKDESSTSSALAMWTPEQVDVIRRLICPGATDDEMVLFANICQRTGLDPFARQIYGIKRPKNVKEGNEWRQIDGPLVPQTSIDGFRLIAERSGKYAGQLGPEWCGKDGQWVDVWLGEGAPSAARVAVLRSDWPQPLWAVARFASYAQRKKDGGLIGLWASMPDNQIAKCAEALALRRAFPQELSGLYSKEELDQADNVPSVVVSPAPKPRRVVTEVVEAEVVERPAPPPVEPINLLAGYDPDKDESAPVLNEDQRNKFLGRVRELFMDADDIGIPLVKLPIPLEDLTNAQLQFVGPNLSALVKNWPAE